MQAYSGPVAAAGLLWASGCCRPTLGQWLLQAYSGPVAAAGNQCSLPAALPVQQWYVVVCLQHCTQACCDC